MTYSEKWQNARAMRAERRAADPKVQARAEAHRRREAQERQKTLRQQAEQLGAAS